VPKVSGSHTRGGPWMFKRRRTYNKARPDQFEARQSSKTPVGFRADGYEWRELRRKTPAAPSHAFKPTDCTGFCTDCLHLVPTGGCWRERPRKFNLLKSKKKLFVFFGFRGFRSGRQGDGVSANFTTSALKTNCRDGVHHEDRRNNPSC
jgi:hypothetical protein